MHNLLLILGILVWSLGCQPEQDNAMKQTNNTAEFNVMSYNIRYDNPGDSTHAWPYRKERVANLIKYHEADLLGLQEALEHQVTYLDSALSEYAWVGVGRDDGDKSGEYSPVFYREAIFELLDWGTFWLSETPDIPSTGWDASLPRIVTWTYLLHKSSGNTLYYFNTHFDHRGVQAREESAKLIRQKIKEIADATPAIVTGDFNANPTSAPYQAMVAEQGLADAMDATLLPHEGALSSFSGFLVADGLQPNRRIDYVFVSPAIEVLKHAILTDHQEGAYPSDHLPVIAQVRLP